MKTKTAIFYQLILSVLLLLQACEEERTEFPRIEILQPAQNQSYAYGDTLLLVFTVQNGGEVHYSLQQDNQPVQVSRQMLSNSEGRYEVAFYLDNKYLQGGSYQLKVKAFNGTVSTSEFLEVFINALPLREKGFASIGVDKLIGVDSAGTVRALPMGDGYQKLATSSRFSQLAIAGERKAITGYDVPLLGQAYSIPRPNPAGSMQYHQILEHQGDIFAVEQGGAVRSYGESGALGKSLNFPAGKEAVQACFIDNKMALATRTLGNSNFDLEIWSEDFLGLVQSKYLGSGNNVLLSAWNEREIAIFINSNSGMSCLGYNLESQQLTSYFTMNQIFVRDCELRQNGEVIFTTNEGVYTFNNSLSLNPIKVLNFGVTDIEVSRANGRVLLLHNDNILQLVAAGNLSSIGPAANGAQDFEILYNK